jgi:hypothetical protein
MQGENAMKIFLWIIVGLYLGAGVIGAVATFKIAEKGAWWKYILIAITAPPAMLYEFIKEKIERR